jgi:hypothetical protein
MECLVTMTTGVPDGTSDEALDEVRGRESHPSDPGVPLPTRDEAGQ